MEASDCIYLKMFKIQEYKRRFCVCQATLKQYIDTLVSSTLVVGVFDSLIKVRFRRSEFTVNSWSMLIGCFEF